MVQKKKNILYNKTFLAWFWLCQMHSELYEVTATAAGFTLGVWVLSCSLFRYWLRDFSGETGTRKQCPSNIKRIVQEENDENGRSQPTLSLSPLQTTYYPEKRGESVEGNGNDIWMHLVIFFLLLWHLCMFIDTWTCNLKTQKDMVTLS